jgi:hypothetical protein
MIPTIGVMIGAYIITKMVAMFCKADANTFTKVLAGITIVVALVSCVDLLNSGFSTSRAMTK